MNILLVDVLQIVEAVPALLEIPLPAIQPNYRPLPSIDITPLSPQRRKGDALTLKAEISPFGVSPLFSVHVVVWTKGNFCSDIYQICVFDSLNVHHLAL